METAFLGTPDTSAWLFSGLVVASFFASYFSIVAGTAGGLLLLVLMASFYPPSVLIPMHTLIQLGAGISRSFAMWQWVLKQTLLPFTLGCIGGAALGGYIFISLPQAILMGVLGLFVLLITWAPQLGRFGPERGRFALLGFGVTVLGVFVSATGTIVGPFVASASPDRRNHVATMSSLMAITHIAKMARLHLDRLRARRLCPADRGDDRLGRTRQLVRRAHPGPPARGLVPHRLQGGDDASRHAPDMARDQGHRLDLTRV